MEMETVSADVMQGNTMKMKRPFMENYRLQMYKKPNVCVVRTFPKGCGSLSKVKPKGEGLVKKVKIQVKRDEQLRVSALRTFPNGCGRDASLDKVLQGEKGSVATLDVDAVEGLSVEEDLVKISKEQEIQEDLGCCALDDAMQTEFTEGNDSDVKQLGVTKEQEIQEDLGCCVLDDAMQTEFTEGNDSDVKQLGVTKEQEIQEDLGCCVLDDATQTEFTEDNDSDVKGKGRLLVENNLFGEQQVVAVGGFSGQDALIDTEKMDDAMHTEITSGDDSDVNQLGVTKEQEIPEDLGCCALDDAMQTEFTKGNDSDVKQLGVTKEQEIQEDLGCYALDDAMQTEFISGNDSDVKGKGRLLVEDNSSGEQAVEVVKNVVLEEHDSVENIKQSAEQTEVSSKNLGPTELFHTLEALMSEKASLYQNLPRRRISAHRDFPARCSMKTLFAGVRESQESAERSIDRRLSDAKSSGRQCVTSSERPNGVLRRGEVQNGDSSKGKFIGTAMHGTRALQYARVRETSDTNLKQRMQGSSQTQSGRAQATLKSIAKKHSFVAGGTSDIAHEVTVKENMGDKEDMRAIVARRKVKETLKSFDDICEELFRLKRANPKETALRRVDCKAATILKKRKLCTNFGVPNVGVVPGVKVGDKFRFRAELAIIGLHRPYQGGIDYYKREWDGKVLALSIVASGGYDDYKDSSDVLIYSGQGGHPVRGAKEATDQKLERGNLGLKNSMLGKSPVRVIRGFDETKGHDLLPGSTQATLTYDGLYDVERLWEEKGPYGTNVFKFLLRRQPGQPELAAA